MAKQFSMYAARERCLRRQFSSAGLKSTTTDLGNGTIIHCWVPKKPNESKPDLLLIHGYGGSSLWQFNDLVRPVARHFNLYVPDLNFFGWSSTTRPERTESFQAQCFALLMDAQGVRRMHVVGLSYGGLVGYSFAAQFKERVDRLVLCCAGVTVEERDLETGLLPVKSVDELRSLLLPQTAAQARVLMKLAFYKPIKGIPTFILKGAVKYLYTEHRQDKAEILYALFENRKLVDLPKITQPTLGIWGDHDKLFPLELAHRLKRHLGGNLQIETIKNAGHALNAEKPKEVYKLLKSFLLGPLPPNITDIGNHNNGLKWE